MTWEGSTYLAHDVVGKYTLSTITANGGLVRDPETYMSRKGKGRVLKLWDTNEAGRAVATPAK